jgi:DNA helicase-2/ATP-dependent DNA helicase PcrA
VTIPAEEEALLERVQRSLAEHAAFRVKGGPGDAQYDQELVALRDEIGEARMEDVPALIAQMERLQGVSLRRAEAQGVLVDPQAPYFAHLRLRERVLDPEGRAGKTLERDVLIGRATFVDPGRRVQIVDWRHAPVSELYYRYGEGSDYEERFGEREVEGEILARRTLTIEDGRLVRIATADDVWWKDGDTWRQAPAVASELAGGQGTAMRASAMHSPRGVLGGGGSRERQQRIDRHLPEISALIDPRQFELVTTPRPGVVVIQGGAGSGKTTIGLHRMAYLAYAHPNRYPSRRMLVVTYGSALAAYISQVLPALGVEGVKVVTFPVWAERTLNRALPNLAVRVLDDAPPPVERVKSHPALLAEVERRARAFRGKRGPRAVVQLWAEIMTDRQRLLDLLTTGRGGLRADEVNEAFRHISERVAAVTDREPRAPAPPRPPRRRGREQRSRERQAAVELAASLEMQVTARPGLDATAVQDDEDDGDEDAEIRGSVGIDGVRTEGEDPELDLGDVALLLRAHQIIRRGKDSAQLCHLFVDEAQDLSPLELSVLIGETEATAAGERSVTLAGDTAQRLFLDNGFADWRTVLEQLHLQHVAVEPLRIAYRSTRQILELARFAMGPLADGEPPRAPRSGAPVEAHRFPGTGAAVGFLAQALRPLFQREPRATVGVLARHPEQADRWFDVLRRAEIPGLRRVRAQDFSFRPGVEVTEIRQVKGLEFDYVVIVEANAATFSTDAESRHLFHIAATRAAHQLWLLCTAAPSPLIPPALLSGES